MSNNGETEGRRLRVALSRFAAMLIEEVRDISGLASYPKIDEGLKYPHGRSYAYSKYPIHPKKTRAPHADEIQDLENRVARLLKRPAHIIVVEENHSLRTLSEPVTVIGVPDIGLNFRDFNENNLQLGYEGDWPTYRRLKYSPQTIIHGNDMRDFFAWQWGVFWDRGVLADPWTREAQGIEPGVPVELFLPALVEQAKLKRALLWKMELQNTGILTETPVRVE
jgi:hypothetical protein